MPAAIRSLVGSGVVGLEVVGYFKNSVLNQARGEYLSCQPVGACSVAGALGVSAISLIMYVPCAMPVARIDAPLRRSCLPLMGGAD
jgi:hypothetical protein